MSNVRRVYVGKKKPYAVKEKQQCEEIRNFLGVSGIQDLRLLIRYDVESIRYEVFETACQCVFSEPPVDILYRETIDDIPKGARVFSVEALPGQFDQRADSAEQCIRFLDPDSTAIVKTAQTWILTGDISDEELEKIKHSVINPVESREASRDKPETLQVVYDQPKDVTILHGFIHMNDEQLEALYRSLGLAMTLEDFRMIQHYFDGSFDGSLPRDPTMTEIRVLDTYWSDHCRHTTFATQLENVTFEDGYYKVPMETTWESYNDTRKELNQGKKDKYPCLMDMAVIAAKKLKAEGKLNDQEDSEENNACSVVLPIEVDYGNGPVKEDWLLFFKNETHNHPTEIEPFGGAATCLGGAIRDPLSGRGYVYQAMRVTGAADPTVPVTKTMEGKLPQKKLVTGAAQGYSSYGNQIGLSTGYVEEIYHPNYAAKRMEIGAVLGAAKKSDVVRKRSEPGDVVILLGGRTGRDGMGGATGSSKVHTEKSLSSCGAEVQKGNAPTERKLQRLFRRSEVTHLIKKCNDFGAGGVAVAIGELADGLCINLDLVPKKYEGLDGTELAISESQERMAVVVDPKDEEQFLSYAEEENLEATPVAVVTEHPHLVMNWRGKPIVDISRAFLNTNGAHQTTDVSVAAPKEEDNALYRIASRNAADILDPLMDRSTDSSAFSQAFTATLSDLNVCSQKGLVERFDSSIGAGTVLMPYGGKYQLTRTQAMVAKIPVKEGKTNAVSLMSYGFDPYLSSWSPYHGAIYAVTESIAKIIASGGWFDTLHFTFQEYFRRMTQDKESWSQPFSALLGAYDAQLGYGIASIGGKDSMSGSYFDRGKELDVPPTLVSFAVGTAQTKDIVSPELKKPGDLLVLFILERDEYDIPVYDSAIHLWREVTRLLHSGEAVAAYAVDGYGVAACAARMAFGNKLGVRFDETLPVRSYFENEMGSILLELSQDHKEILDDLDDIDAQVVGTVLKEGCGFEYGTANIPMEKALASWEAPLENVFPTRSSLASQDLGKDIPLYTEKNVHICSHPMGKPTVFIPVFPGTNCEYDSAYAFEKAGARTIVKVFRNNTPDGIRESEEEFSRAIADAQIIMFPGGFSAGDEPDGSAKFFAASFRSPRIREEVMKLLYDRDGLALGICNGFQALIKLGLVPNGKMTGQQEDSPTLTFNTIGRHISKEAYIKVVSNKSPWLQKAELGGVYVNPASHGEGRFVCSRAWLDQLTLNGQIATRYCDPEGTISMDEEWNINGSYGAVEGIISPDGRVYGKMCHAERIGDHVAVNIAGEQDMKIFESGVQYFA